jgi:glycine cleavage system regulatory protein
LQDTTFACTTRAITYVRRRLFNALIIRHLPIKIAAIGEEMRFSLRYTLFERHGITFLKISSGKQGVGEHQIQDIFNAAFIVGVNANVMILP